MNFKNCQAAGTEMGMGIGIGMEIEMGMEWSACFMQYTIDKY